MGGQGGAAAGAIGHDLVALVEQALIGHLLERPPDGFDVVVVVGDIGVVHVRPEADAVGHLFPLALVLPDGFFALLDERLDAVLFNLLLAVQAQQLFHFQLHRQAVGVPTGLAQNVLALHGLIAGNEVFDGAGFDVADVGLAVGRGRAVEEGKFLAALAVFDGFFKDAVVLPERFDLGLALDEIEIRGNLFKHATTPPKNIPRPPHGTRFSRYHPIWRQAPAHGMRTHAFAITGEPGDAYWPKAFGLPLRGDPPRFLPPGLHRPRLATERLLRKQSPSRRFYHLLYRPPRICKGKPTLILPAGRAGGQGCRVGAARACPTRRGQARFVVIPLGAEGGQAAGRPRSRGRPAVVVRGATALAR